jgi:hypothetical protein
MLIDSTGLGYTARGGEIMLHYPPRAGRDARGGGALDAEQDYVAGWPIGPFPAWYWRDPPNAITAERVRLWAELLTMVEATEN